MVKPIINKRKKLSTERIVMGNLVKINEVLLYTGPSSRTELKQALEEVAIKYTQMHYADESVHPEVIRALNTWTWGLDQKSKKFDKFPIITWKEYYDDWKTALYNITDIAELKGSAIYLNKSLIE